MDGKTFKTRLSRCELVIEHARELAKYEQRGIPTIRPLPSSLAEEFERMREKIIVEESTAAAQKSRSKAEVAATPASRSSALSSGLLAVQEIGDRLREGGREPDPNAAAELEQLIVEQKRLIQTSKLDGFLEAARKAEFMNNRRKALTQYQEALFFLLNDDVPDVDQAAEIETLKQKIADLSGGG